MSAAVRRSVSKLRSCKRLDMPHIASRPEHSLTSGSSRLSVGKGGGMAWRDSEVEAVMRECFVVYGAAAPYI